MICHSWSAFVAASLVAVVVAGVVAVAVLEPGVIDLVNSPVGSYPYP